MKGHHINHRKDRTMETIITKKLIQHSQFSVLAALLRVDKTRKL